MAGPASVSQLVFRGEIVTPAEVLANERAAGTHSVLDVHQVRTGGERKPLVRVNFQDRHVRRLMLLCDIERGEAAFVQFADGDRAMAVAALADLQLLRQLESGWAFAAAGWAFNR